MNETIEDEVLNLVRAGVTTRFRLVRALPARSADEVRDAVARLSPPSRQRRRGSDVPEKPDA